MKRKYLAGSISVILLMLMCTSMVIINPIKAGPTVLIANFTWSPNPGYYGEPVDFHGNPSGGWPPISYYWTFPGGIHFTTQDCSFTFYPTTSPTNYQVTLTVTDSHGAQDSVTFQIPIHISYDVYCLALSSDKLTYHWNEKPILYPVVGNYGDHICPECTVTLHIGSSTGTYTFNNIGPHDSKQGTKTMDNPGAGTYIPWFTITSNQYDTNHNNDGISYAFPIHIWNW